MQATPIATSSERVILTWAGIAVTLLALARPLGQLLSWMVRHLFLLSLENRLDRVEALEAEVKTADYRMREAADQFKEMDEDHMSARRVLEDLKGRMASSSAQLREIREAQERADAQWELLENEIARSNRPPDLIQFRE